MVPLPAHAATADSIIESARPGPYTELDTNRPGNDYKNFDLSPTTNANICEVSCNNDAKCIAWTFVRPGIQGANARCWLKTSVPRAYPNKCCVSGLKPGYCDSGWYWDTKDRTCHQRIN